MTASFYVINMHQELNHIGFFVCLKLIYEFFRGNSNLRNLNNKKSGKMKNSFYGWDIEMKIVFTQRAAKLKMYYSKSIFET